MSRPTPFTLARFAEAGVGAPDYVAPPGVADLEPAPALRRAAAKKKAKKRARAKAA